ncbi:DUF6895 family protein [Roseateles sp. DB2]|uniref:DUF6895 family protein n=1 Tax=Roseateles sp. DB2 TaxID=3453717 RepID=UPI003EE8CACB
MQTSPLSPALVRQARDQALAWLAAHAQFCDPHLGATPQEYLFRRKCFNELAMLLMVGERLCMPPTGDWLRLRGHVARQIDDRFLALAARRNGTLLMFTSALGLAVQQGWLDDERSAWVRRLLCSRYAWGIDGGPFRHLELLTACHYAGAPAPVDVEVVLRTSALAHAPSPIHASQDALFALTHAEYYRTLLDHDFAGADPYLPTALSGAMARCLAGRDLDLGLELVETACLRGLPLGAEAQELLMLTLPALVQQGWLSPDAPTWVARDFAAACPEQAAWAQRFHLTLVAATCCMSLLAPAAPALPAHDAGQLRNARQLGAALLGLHQYKFESALAALGKLAPLSPPHAQLLDDIREFIVFSQRRDGHFGHFVDELRRAGISSDDAPAIERLFAGVDQACLGFLAQPACTPATAVRAPTRSPDSHAQH